MQLQVGKSYKTRCGGSAFIEKEHIDEPVYQFSGRCFDRDGDTDRIAYWMSNGRYNASIQSGFDLIAEVAVDAALATRQQGEL